MKRRLTVFTALWFLVWLASEPAIILASMAIAVLADAIASFWSD